MKRVLLVVVFLGSAVFGSDGGKGHEAPANEVVHVATALDHLTVIEFGEPVTMAAAGSPSFQIERHDDKVFIKPLKARASTNLFVWTASRSFTFELEPPGDVKNMNAFVDIRPPAPAPTPDMSRQLDETADMMLTRAFLGAEPVAAAASRTRRTA